MVLISIADGHILAGSISVEAKKTASAALLNTAGVLGGMAGLLFAVLVFGVQFHAERLGHASFLVRFLAKREGIVPVAAFTLSVIAANLLLGLLTTQDTAHIAVAMARFDVIYIPLVFTLTLWLIFRMVVVTSGDFFEESLKPGLAWEYQRGLDEEIHREKLLRVYHRTLSQAKIGHNSMAALAPLQSDGQHTLILRRTGMICDVDLREIANLGRLANQLCPEYEVLHTIAPYDKINRDGGLVLRPKSDENGRILPHEPLGDKAKEAIDTVLHRAFLVTAHTDREIVGSLVRFYETIVSYGRHDRPDQLKRALDVYEHLVEQRLKRGIVERAEFTFSFDRMPDFLEGFDHFELAEGAVNTADKQKIEVAMTFAVRVMNIAIAHRHVDLFRSAGALVEAVYLHGHKQAGLQPWLGHTVDMWINHILEQFQPHYRTDEDSKSLTSMGEKLPLFEIVMAWTLRLIKKALEGGQAKDALDFHDRMAMFDRGLDRAYFADQDTQVPKEVRLAESVHKYSMIVLAAWCLYLSHCCGIREEVIETTFRRCAASFGTREQLIAVWESIPRGTLRRSLLDERLGLDNWSRPGHRLRTGTTTDVFLSHSWMPDGFVALCLTLPSARRHRTPDDLAQVPAVGYDLQSLEAKANSLIGDEYVRDRLLGKDEQQGIDCRRAFLELIRERICKRKRAELERIHAAVVSKARVEVIQQKVSEAIPERRSMARTIRHLGGMEVEAGTASLLPIRLREREPKAIYLENQHAPVNHAEILAEMVAKQESFRLAYVVEQNAQELQHVNRLRDLQLAISTTTRVRLKRLDLNGR